MPFTCTRGGRRKSVRVTCRDSAIQLPLPTTPAELLHDLHEIEKICAKPDPLEHLDFIDRIRKLKKNGPVVQQLEEVLEQLLADPDSPRLALCIPGGSEEDYSTAQTFRVSKGARSRTVEDLDVATLLEFVSPEPDGRRLKALKDVRVQMFGDSDAQDAVNPAIPARRWLTANVSKGPGRFFYHQGEWYEIGAEYLSIIEQELKQLFSRGTTVDLPPWPRNADGTLVEEGDYNERVCEREGYVLFDKKKLVTRKFKGGGVEICDVLGPGDQLICAKKASHSQGTAPLDHLFTQGTTAVEFLRNEPEVRRKFLEQLASRAPGREAPDDLGKITLVYAILLKGGEEINVNSLFAFAQVSFYYRPSTASAQCTPM